MSNLIDYLYGKTREFAGSIQVNLNALIKGKIETTSTASDSIKTAGGVLVNGSIIRHLHNAPALNLEASGGASQSPNFGLFQNIGGDRTYGIYGQIRATSSNFRFISRRNNLDTSIFEIDNATNLTTFFKKVNIDDTTEATTTTNGSLQTDGGLSVAKSIFAGGKINVGNFFNIDPISGTPITSSWNSTSFNARLMTLTNGANANSVISGNTLYSAIITNTQGNGLRAFSVKTDGVEKAYIGSAGGGYFAGKLQVDDTTEATNTTDGSLQTDGGLSVAKNVVVGGSVQQNGGGVYTVSKSIANNTATNIFTISGGDGTFAGQIYITGARAHQGVSSIYNIVSTYGSVVVSNVTSLARSTETVTLSASGTNMPTKTFSLTFTNFSGDINAGVSIVVTSPAKLQAPVLTFATL